jgi:ATP-dependent helicase/nuclease subunit A
MEGVETFDPQLGKGVDGPGLRLRRGVAAAAGEAREAQPARAAEPLPAWAEAPAAAEPEPLRLWAPSQLFGTDEPPPDSPVGPEAEARYRRGILIHRLLQLLPDVAPDGRAAAAERLLGSLAGDLSQTARARIALDALDLLARPDLGPVFGPGSRAEQPLCGVVAGQAIVGQVDRLAVTEHAVLMVDYKSHRAPPRTVEGTPSAYLRQLAAYRSLLRAIYPGREVKAALLWTAVPRLDLIPAGLLDRHAPETAAAAPPLDAG